LSPMAHRFDTASSTTHPLLPTACPQLVRR
jgi:hypothetical protein